MSLGTITSVAQTVFAALQCSELKELCSLLGYKSQLDKLEKTVKTVKAVLLDAEARDDQEFSHQAQLFIEELKEVVYEADDLLDEFVTIAERKHKKLFNKGAAPIVSVKLRRLFSRIKDVPFAYKMSQKVKEIRKKLDDIADNHNNFGFKIDSQPIRKRRERTCSYVYTPDIIGRDGDKEKIVGMLLDPNVRRDVSFLTIVGIGGLGKTTLAQLIYNDERIQKAFPTRLWACVGDDDPNRLNVNLVLDKILGSSSGQKSDEFNSDFLGDQVRRRLAGNKYLLVLDDIWNENRHHWLNLEAFLKGGSTGSWVLVTTRSRETAKIVGDGSLYELECLSDEDSWRLFEKVAFGQEEGQANPSDLVEIGQKIVRKCANIPLAIRVTGSLLYGQAKNKWSSVEKNGLTQVSAEKNDILPILKFSYHHLDSPLKSCFGYCALFPKDYEIEKDMLVSLWMAQGFIVPLERDQSIEDAGEEYISILLRRCFFQDVEKDEDGEIIAFKLHDLMHDVAQEVTKTEVRAIDWVKNDLDKKNRHVSSVRLNVIEASFTMSKVRTLLCLHKNHVMLDIWWSYSLWAKRALSVGTLVDKCKSLRALDLSYSNIEKLPDQISKLLHLRYLDLSWNAKMKMLPKSFTKLHNLETLLLKACSCLIELPSDFAKLVKLRCLDLEDCAMITHMPTGMGKLSSLHKLTTFAVDLSNSSYGDVLEGLQNLIKIKGDLEIRVKGFENGRYEKGSNSEGGYLRDKQHLNSIQFSFKEDEGGEDNEEALMEDMQPHGNLRRLSLENFKGKKLPSWAREDNLTASLQMLEQIDFSWCTKLEYLSSFEKLGHLRILRLEGLKNLEYIEDKRERRGTGAGAGAKEGCLCFPSLVELKLESLHKLNGWWREEEEGVEDDDDDEDDDEEKEDDGSSRSSTSSQRKRAQVSPLFPHLSTLEITDCPELSLIFRAPNVEQVDLWEQLSGRWGREEEATYSSSSSNNRSNIYVCTSHNSSKLREVATSQMRCLKSSLPMEALQCLTELYIQFDEKLERLEEIGEVWRSCFLSSLRILQISECNNLKSVGKVGLHHLTSLEELTIRACYNFTITQETEAEGEDITGDEPSFTPPLPLTLHSLKLCQLPKMVNMPVWVPHLTSLTHLTISRCSEELKQRCSRSPPGQDWPKIQHIPHVYIE